MAWPNRSSLFPAGALLPATFKTLLTAFYDQTVALLGSAGTPAGARTALGAADDTAVVKLTGNQTIAGTKTFSSPPVALNASKAWVNFTGSTGVINGTAHNVSSVTDVAVGSFTVNFSSALANANYAPSVTVQNTVFSDYGNVGATMSTTQLSITTARGDTGALVDVSKVFVNVMGS